MVHCRNGFGFARRLGLVNAALAALLAVALHTAPALAAEARAISILLLGDSLAAGYGLDAADAFPVRLERALAAKGHDVRVLNGGVSGDTSAGGLARLDWALEPRPDGVIVELGANDGLRGIEPRATRANLAAIIERLKAHSIPVLLAGMKAPRNLGADYAEEFDAIYPSLAQEYGVPLYPFFLDGVALDPGLNQGDGIHPNAKGVERIVAGVLPMVEALIARIAAKSGTRAPADGG